MAAVASFTSAQYRRFGWLATVALAVAAWRFQSAPLFVAAALLLLLATVWPLSLRQPHALLTALTRPIGLLIGQILLMLVFFGMIAPLALVFRLLGRDPLRCLPDADATTYWQPRIPITDTSFYLRSF